MAKNDKLLLDQIVAEIAKDEGRSIGDVFQSFAVREALKAHDLTSEEIELGIVDGRDDGGVDAWYTFLDGELITDPDDAKQRRCSTIDVWVFTAKHHDTFRQEPVVHLYATALDLLDLSKDHDDLSARYNDDLLASRTIFKNSLIRTVRSSPQLQIKFCYLSRGDTEQIGQSIEARSSALVAACHNLFSDCRVTFDYLGSRELLAASRKVKDFSAVLTFEEGPVSRGGTNYVGLATLSRYRNFIVDPEGNLKRYLFESNVRDYMGRTPVNSSIVRTLKSREPSEVEDFWWLNNGVTVIADKAKVIGKDLHLDNVQIVNGLQTTEAVYQYFAEVEPSDDRRCILVKVLVTSQKALADKIILATNNQNKVDLASLHATDKIQRDIEDILGLRGWYYDRRKNYYLNQGKPSSRIVSMTYMSWVVLSVLLGEPFQCNRSRPRFVQSPTLYRRIFSDQYDLQMYVAALEFSKNIGAAMLALGFCVDRYESRPYESMYRFLYAHLYATVKCGRRSRSEKDVTELGARGIDHDVLLGVHRQVIGARASLSDQGHSLRRLHRSREFQELLERGVLSESRGERP